MGNDFPNINYVRPKRSTLESVKISWNNLKRKQKISFLILISSVLAILTLVSSTLTIQRVRSRAAQSLVPTNEPDFANLVPLNIPQPIYGFMVDGNVSLDNDNAFLRVVLVDKSKNEYLVYETYSAIADRKSFSVKNTCEETCVLPPVSPDHLRIEGNFAKFNISKTSFTTEEGQINQQVRSTDFKNEKDKEKITKLNKIIQKKGLKWVAGETSISKLTYAQKKRLFPGKDGKPVEILPNLQGFEYYKSGVFEIKTGSSPPPPSNLVAQWDWRSRHGQNWITPVKNQLGCNSCWAFSAISTTEAVINLYYNQILNIDLSEQDTVCKHLLSCQYGGSTVYAFYELKTEGLVTESCYPYTGTETCPGRCANSKTQLWKITDYKHIDQWPLDDNITKYTLITSGPIPFGVISWQHVMSLVGYEREPVSGQTVWIVKSSWGTYWGENGFGKIIVPENDRYSTQYIEQPYFTSNPNLYQIACTDKDKDGFCNWGISAAKPVECPTSCKTQKDCDDSNPGLGPYDSSYNCMTTTPTPTDKPTPPPTSKPGCGTVCQSNPGCRTGLICYQPPSPSCPPKGNCIQVMPGTSCRNPSCPTKTDCVCGSSTLTPVVKPTPTVTPTPTSAR